MICTICGTNRSAEDNFCGNCGAVLEPSAVQNTRLPVKRQQSLPPAVWQQAAPAVARGAALVVAGLAAEWLIRAAAQPRFVSPADILERAEEPRSRPSAEWPVPRRNPRRERNDLRAQVIPSPLAWSQLTAYWPLHDRTNVDWRPAQKRVIRRMGAHPPN